MFEGCDEARRRMSKRMDVRSEDGSGRASGALVAKQRMRIDEDPARRTTETGRVGEEGRRGGGDGRARGGCYSEDGRGAEDDDMVGVRRRG